ncbi:tetratricopeptide repeat protein [bacterium]|nr:tetratricopeptide repeat protein [bacterium]
MNDSAVDLYKKFQVAEPEPFGSNLDILIADPQSDVRLILTHHLQKLGFANVRVAKDGMAALLEMRRQPANILLLSNEFDGPTAMDIIQELREDPSLQRDVVILCSNPLVKPEVMLGLESGFDDFLIKPIIPNEIMPKIRTAHQVFSSHKNPERIYEFAKMALKLNELDHAENVYSELAKQTQHAARPYVGLARIALLRGDPKGAMNFVKTAIQKNPKYTHAHSFLGDLYLAEKRLDEALASYREAIELSPLNVVRYEVATEALLTAGRVDEAISILEIATQAKFENPFIIERLGYCYFQKKEYQKAAKFLRQAVHAEPDNVSFMNSLAICYRDANLYDEALDTYNAILKRDNENRSVMFNKALLLNMMNRTEEAIKLLKKVLAKHPDFQKAKEKIVEFGGTPDAD